MSTTKFFPPITAILPVDALPNELGFVKTGLTNILSHIYFRDLQYSHNDRGDSAFYSLSIVSLKRLDIEIPGTGIFLILNPGHGPLATDISEFPISLSYSWPILGYLRQFNLETFSFQPGDIFDLALRVVGVTPRQVVERALNLFVPSASPIDTLVDDVNALFGTSIAHPSPTSPDPLGDVLEAMDNSAGINGAGGAVFALYLLDALSEETTRDRISTFFEDFFSGDRIENYIKQLLTPKIEATLEVGLAIEFPRNVLEPLDAIGGKPLADPTIKTWLSFDAGSFFYSSSRGIGFDQMLVATLNHPSRIAGTSFGISLHKAKLDISRTTNIPEATADGRPVDFVGVYIDDATLSFPTIWNHDEHNSTGVIKGKSLIIGTAGVSGTLSLEAVNASHPSPVVKVKFGKDFSISLDKFSIKLKQNAIVESTIEGTLLIPGFTDANKKPAEIRIKVAIRQDGDFDVTAHVQAGLVIKCGEIFDLTIRSAYFGKKDDEFYFGVSGTIKFNGLLSGISPIEVEKLIIWSDGRIEIEGGTIPLPKNIRFPIGPAELSISAIHLGSNTRLNPDGTTRDFQYFGFDGGLDINPGGVDMRGRGIKFHFPMDRLLAGCYLEIESIAIDLVIPGNASKDTATLLMSGFLSIGGTSTDPVYEGGISFALPRARIAGGASMKYQPKKPAFLVKAFVELSTPIPLGATSLGIYGFDGLFGQRYVPNKKDTETWFDYYKGPPSEGVSISKFQKPDETKGYDNPFAVGAGVSLATMQNSGRPFSCKLFLLLSLPDVIYLEGKANILGPRVGLTGEDPPFSAVLAISSQSVELAAGVNYKSPRDGPHKGWILDLHAEMRAAFFFHNSSAWYINVGTIENPTTARVLSLFNASLYLKLSASGIVAGAGVTYGFEKSYAGGLVHASVGVYIKVGGFISFERPQIGGFAMLGGHVDVRLLGISFYVVIDTSLSVEAPRPFYVQGMVHLCVGVTIGFWKFKKHIEKCFDVEFKWEKDPTVDITPVLPFADVTNPALPPLKATNMLSGESFNIVYLGTSPPSPTSPLFDQAVLPLDSWVDIEFLKGLLPGPAVDARIGRLSGQAPANTIDYIPPANVAHKVKHQYSIKAVEIKAWSGSAWVDYRPYEAMSPPNALAALKANPSAYKDGFWQNSGAGFNKLRLLAETSLSYMQQGQPGWYVPEQFGLTSATLFCRGSLRDKHCIRWIETASGTVYPDGAWKQIDTVLCRVSGGPGTVIDWPNHFGIPRSLVFANDVTAQIVFNEPSAELNLKLTTFSSGAVIRFYKRETVGPRFVYTLVETRSLTQLQLLAPVKYDNATIPVAKVEIDPTSANPASVYALMVQIDALYRQLYEGKLSGKPRDALVARIGVLEQELAQITGKGCMPNGFDKDTLVKALAVLQRQLEECIRQFEVLQAAQQNACAEAANFSAQFKHCFPNAPSRLSYEILQRSDLFGRAEFVFRVYDDQSEAILFDGTQPYSDALTAERATFATLELALWPGDYALMAPKDRPYFLQLVDTSGRFAAVSPTTFTTWDQLIAFWEQTQTTVRAAHAGGKFALARRVAGKLTCEARLDHLDCWNDLSVFGAGNPLSYDVVEERNAAGLSHFRFRVYDEHNDSVLLNGALQYPDATAAEIAMFDTLELAPYLGDYALMAPKDGQYFFQLVDTSGRFAAVSPAHFTQWDQLVAFVEQTQTTVQKTRARGAFVPTRRGARNCQPIVTSIISARDAYCSQYDKLYRDFYDCNKQLLDEAIRNCEELTHGVDLQHTACQALSDQLAALQQLINFSDANGPLLPPEAFPCSTLLHEACGLSLEDYQFNVSVPSQAAIEQDYTNAVQAIEKMLTPIWRPDTKYSIRLQVTDTVNNDTAKDKDSDFYFGFRTAGPVGYFDKDQAASYVISPKTPDQYMLTSLKGYIDYRRSYPNADGQLIGAKPLFYEDARILLFFTKRYAYHFFVDWPAYNGLPALSGNAIQIIIKDPAENISFPNPPPLTTTTTIPQAVVTWPADSGPRIPEDIRTLANLRNPKLLNPHFVGGGCWQSGGDMIKPASVYTSITPQYLKPLKLYTIIANNVYNKQIQEVHRFVAQTSRYPDFAAQVNSYHLDDGKGNQRDAIFRIGVPLSVADINLLYDVVKGTMSAPNAALAGTWTNPFDRLVEGVMKLAPLDVAISTEFNIVRNSTTSAVVAVWIRNPEPFNDPKLPDDVLQRSLLVMNGLDPDPDPSYEVLFSKDGSQAFVMHPSRIIPVTQMKFRFAYIEWDGNDYMDRKVIISGVIHTNI